VNSSGKSVHSGLVSALEAKGIPRREFLRFCGLMAGTLALPAGSVGLLARALENRKRPVLVWLEFQDCAGNSESMLRSGHPTITEVVLNLLSWEYHELVMAGAGSRAEAALERVLKEEKGKFIAVVEGAIPTADGGIYCTIGGRTALDIVRDVCPKAAATIAMGACAWDGGFVAASPNPTGAVGVQDAVPGIRVVNMGGCPANAVNMAAVITHYLAYDKMPALDSYGRPLFAHANLIHDQCEKRAHFDAGRFVEKWGDEGHVKGWCLYHMGCKGPVATYNCPMARWNDQTSWPVKAGHGCIACASRRFWDTASPFYKRLPSVPGFGADITAGTIGGVVLGAVAAGTALHAAGSLLRRASRPKTEPPTPAQPAAADKTPSQEG
jgi:hydrogenase small subunit